MEGNELSIDLGDYGGGIAIWGAIPPVFDTAAEKAERGVHVHARRKPNSHKVIDNTFSKVNVKQGSEVFIISEEETVPYNVSSILGIPLRAETCPSCGRSQLDSLSAVINPGALRACWRCGAELPPSAGALSNPICTVKAHLGDLAQDRQLKPVTRKFQLNPQKYPGGFQIWGSNPAVVWTSVSRVEEEGVHVHAFNEIDKRTQDNTFGTVSFGSEPLDPVQVRVYMAQTQLPWLDGRIIAERCQKCAAPFFDVGKFAYLPIRRNRHCGVCGESSGSSDRISNPIIETLKSLHENLTR